MMIWQHWASNIYQEIYTVKSRYLKHHNIENSVNLELVFRMVKNSLLYAPYERVIISLIICLSIYITLLIMIRFYHIKEYHTENCTAPFSVHRHWHINLDLKLVSKVKVIFILLDDTKVKIFAYSKYWCCNGCNSWFHQACVGKKEGRRILCMSIVYGMFHFKFWTFYNSDTNNLRKASIGLTEPLTAFI